MLYMAAAVLLAAACSPEEDDIFSDSSANRADAAIAADMQVLTGAANGWLMEYYPEASQMYGGYNILLSFSEDGRVTVAGDIVSDPTATATSLFSVKQSAGIVLSFDTYNEIFHFFSDPGNSTGGGNGYGLEGDYDFLILEATPQQVRLKGKKSGSYAVLTPMEGDWAAYIQEVQAAEATMQANSYQISDGTNTASVSVNYRNMTISYQEGEEALSMPVPFIVTPTGYKFYEPITLWGKTLTGFTYDAASDSFTETSGTGITMIKIIPPINEQFVSGTWYMSYSGLGSFGQHYFDAVTPYLESEGEELVYDLLRIFCGYGDGNIRRIRDGVGNKAKDGRTVLIPNLISYRSKGELDFHDEIKAMQEDPKIVKHSPRLYVVSDGQTIVALDPKEQDIYENEVSLMWKDFDFFYPLAGIEKIRNVEEAEADVKSAELMAKIFDEIRRHNDIKDRTEMHNLNIFMSRLLFCYFAEDTHLFPEPQLFTNSIKQHTAEDGHDLAEFIDRAFLAMSTNDPVVLDTLPRQFSIFPYVNGGLFEKRVPIPVLSRRARVLMIKCGDFDWKDINPDIFGSMIQAVVTPEMRAGLGMHYTSVPNIMKLIRPLFLDGLYEEFNVAKDTHDKKRLQRLLVRLGKIKTKSGCNAYS